jgi:hypothetical protein
MRDGSSRRALLPRFISPLISRLSERDGAVCRTLLGTRSACLSLQVLFARRFARDVGRSPRTKRAAKTNLFFRLGMGRHEMPQDHQ